MDLMKRRREIIGRSRSVLPPEYQQLEYIKTPVDSGLSKPYNAFICTEMPYNSIGKIVCKYGVLTFAGGNAPVFLAAYASGTTTVTNPFIALNGTTGNSGMVLSPRATPPYDGTLNEYTVECSVVSSSNKLRIGGWSDGVWTAVGTYYYVDVYDKSNNLVAKCLPCYRKADEVVGLYDTIGKEFYSSAGSQNFEKPV
jgi:hypothetical protein